MAPETATRWRELIEAVQRRLDSESHVVVTIEEIAACTQCDAESIRKRWFWRALQLGSRGYGRFVNAGLRVEFSPDVHGCGVERVTFTRRSE